MTAAVTRRWAGLAFKAAVTVALIALVLRGVDLGLVGDRVAGLSPLAAILSIALLMLHCLVAGWRWRMIMRLFGPQLALPRAVRLFFEGYFFNNALPSTIGGDAVRIWRASESGLPLDAGINGVVLDRITGLAGLFILVALGQPLLYARVGDPATRLAFALILLAGAAGIAALILVRLLPLRRLPRRLHDGVAALSGAAHAAFLRPSVSLPVLGLSVLVHGLIVLSVYVIALGLGVDLGLFGSLVLVPAVILLSTVPLAVGGWGLREGLMVVALGLAAIPADAAFSVSVLFGVAQIVASLPGGVAWLLARGGAVPASVTSRGPGDGGSPGTP